MNTALATTTALAIAATKDEIAALEATKPDRRTKAYRDAEARLGDRLYVLTHRYAKETKCSHLEVLKVFDLI